MSVFNKYGFSFSKRQNLLIKTDEKAEVIRNMSKSKLRQINEAKKNGSVIRPPANIGELKDFYEILKQLYKKKIRKPLADWSFFETFYNMSNEGKLGIIRLVFFGDKVIGGVVAPVTGSKAIYEWYIAGQNRKYADNYPGVLATWAPIDYALENGIGCFDLMGLGIPDKPYGVRNFKLKFGGQSVYYGRFERRNNKILYSIIKPVYYFLYLLKSFVYK